jgi:hypothetical protein
MVPHTVLGYNLLFDHCQRNLKSVRHNIFSYCEPVAWPPEAWEPGKFCCWHCVQSLDNPPVPAPHSRDVTSGRFLVYGFFCRWSCAKQYLIESQPWAASEKLLLLEELAYSFGYHGGPILPAPPRHSLKIFGGDLSPRSFHEEGLRGIMRVTHTPPLIVQPFVYVCSNGVEAQIQKLADPRWTRPVKERVLIQAAMQKPEVGLPPAETPAREPGLYAQFIDRHGINLATRAPQEPEAEETKPKTETAPASSSGTKPVLTLGSLGSLRSSQKTADAAE